MPLDDRDYIRGRHPPTCTCTECVNRRLKRLGKEARPNYISVCPRCGKKSLFYNGRDRIYECLNLKCKAVGYTPEQIKGYSGSPKEAGRTSHPTKPTSKKFRYPKPLKNIIRLCLNLAVLAGLGVLVRHSYFLFTHKLSPLSGSIALIIGITIWVLLIIFLNKKYRWVKPTFKLTTFLTIVVLLIFAFAGVQPMSAYKDTLVERWKVTTTTPPPTQPIPSPETPSKIAPVKPPEPMPVKPPVVTVHRYTLQEVASQIHTLINSERTKQGLSPLRVDILLTSLAEEHSESMVLNGFFGHERALGGRSFGYGQQPGTLRGENISKTPQRRVIPGPYLTLEEVCTWVVSGWMSSLGHRNNILEPKFTRTGIGVSLLGEYLYITQIFEGTY